MEDYTRAADQFRKVTELGLPNSDANLYTALFNLGAVYKNWGARMQRDAGSNATKAQVDAYKKKLQESIGYFERARDINSADFAVLAELGNLYEVLDQKPKLQTTIRSLEAVEADNTTNRDYWRALSRLYLMTGDEKKAEAADRKASQ